MLPVTPSAGYAQEDRLLARSAHGDGGAGGAQVAGRPLERVTSFGKPNAEPFRLAAASLAAQARRIEGGADAQRASPPPFSAIYHGAHLHNAAPSCCTARCRSGSTGVPVHVSARALPCCPSPLAKRGDHGMLWSSLPAAEPCEPECAGAGSALLPARA